MGSKRRNACLMVIWLMTASVIGCSGDSSSKVSGKVTLDGNPAGGVALSFHAPSGEVSNFGATTKDDGTYEFKIPAETKFEEAQYRVVATKYALKKGAKAQLNPDEGMDLDQLKESGQAVNVLPRVYSSIDSTPLKADLKRGDVTANFELKSK